MERLDAARWAYALLPAGAGLSPLPPWFWDSREIREAGAHGSPGTVIAAVRRAHGLSQGRLGALAGFSQSAISRLESGGNIAYDVRVLRIFQRLLGIPPHLLGLSDTSFPLLPEDASRLLDQLAPGAVTVAGRAADGRTVPVAVDRYTLFAACTSSVLGTLPVDSVGSVDEDHPVDPDAVRRLRVVRRLLNESDNWLGPGNLAPAVREIYEITGRMRRAATGAVRQQLLDVAALYAEFCGWLHQEVGDLRGAVEWTERALQQAQAADDSELVAYVYVRMGQLAEAEGDGDRVIGLARAAQREQGLSDEVQALALQQEARGQALAQDAAACLSTFDKASEVTRNIRSRWTDEYRIGYYFTENHLAVQQASCLLELGRSRDAIARYEDSEPSRAMLCWWEQGLHLAKFARAHAAAGDLDHAGALASEALAVGRSTGSTIVRDELRKLAPWAQTPAIAAVTSALDTPG